MVAVAVRVATARVILVVMASSADTMGGCRRPWSAPAGAMVLLTCRSRCGGTQRGEALRGGTLLFSARSHRTK
jgi:hypothetical protein